MTKHANIVITEKSCVIYPKKRSVTGSIVGYCILIAFFVWANILAYSHARHTQEFSWVIWAILYILLAVGIYLDIKGIKKPLRPIVLTKTDVTLPSGEKVKWQDVDSICMRYKYVGIADLCLKVKKHFVHTSINGERSTECLTNEWISDWYLYANKKKLISLFEEYAGRQLYRSAFRKQKEKCLH